MSEKFEFLNLLNLNENFTPLYLQLVNGDRLKYNKVAYIFDEVGCGKTVSAIIGIAQTLKEWEVGYKDQKNRNHCDILIFTPNAVTTQFLNEIYDKLGLKTTKIVKNGVYICKHKEFTVSVKNFSEMGGSVLDKCYYGKYDKVEDANIRFVIININMKTGTTQTISNYYENTKWDLIIMDEAQIILNDSDANRKVTESHRKYLQEMKDKTCYPLPDEFRIVNGATNGFSLYHLTQLNSEKLMFLTATPTKYDFLDYYNYAFLASAILDEKPRYLNKMWYFKYNPKYYPDLEIFQYIYNGGNKTKIDLKRIVQSNTSFMFKEITLAIPYDSLLLEKIQYLYADLNGNAALKNWKYFTDTVIKMNNLINETNRMPAELKGKDSTNLTRERIVELWDNKDNNNLFLREKIFTIIKEKEKEINNKGETLKNRIIFFVHKSEEGKELFDLLFPNSNYDICKFKNHQYKDEESGITCEFIMNKFANTWNLENYTEENETIPDILIVTWQSTQVGINLPTFNHVVHYHIPNTPGNLEQRFGRIDRLNTEYKKLYNIYYVSSNKIIYRQHLTEALIRYRDKLINKFNKTPTKNVLIGKGITTFEIGTWAHYEWLAILLHSLLNLGENINTSKDLQGTAWENSKIVFGEDKITINKGNIESSVGEVPYAKAVRVLDWLWPYNRDYITCNYLKDKDNFSVTYKPFLRIKNLNGMPEAESYKSLFEITEIFNYTDELATPVYKEEDFQTEEDLKEQQEIEAKENGIEETDNYETQESETDTESKTENPRQRIQAMSRKIVKIENLNNMIKKLNLTPELGKTGNLIYFNDDLKKQISINCEDIAESIVNSFLEQ